MSDILERLRRVEGYDFRCGAGPLERCQDWIDLKEEVAGLLALVNDYEEAIADKRRLAREIDVALHGHDGAAKQASLCDLVAPADRLRSLTAELVEALEHVRNDISLTIATHRLGRDKDASRALQRIRTVLSRARAKEDT